MNVERIRPIPLQPKQAVAYARAVARMSKEGMTGCVTVLDIPPAYLSAKSGEELRKSML